MPNTFSKKYKLYTGEKLNEFQIILKIGQPIVTEILPWVVFFTSYGFVVAIFYELWDIPVLISAENRALSTIILVFNIGLPALLAFRTNTAHQRFWEARLLWGQLVNVSRNLTRDICIIVKDKNYQNKREKENTLFLVVAFAVAIKLHLRAEPVNEELSSLMSRSQYWKLKHHTNHPPLQIAFWIGDYLQSQYEDHCLNVYQLTALHRLVDILVDILGGCERILKTPQPIIYSLMIKKLIIVYCLLIPLKIVSDCHGFTSVVMTFTSLVLLGIEQIGSQLEQPFARNPSNLPLDSICNVILLNIKELIESIDYKSTQYKYKDKSLNGSSKEDFRKSNHT